MAICGVESDGGEGDLGLAIPEECLGDRLTLLLGIARADLPFLGDFIDGDLDRCCFRKSLVEENFLDDDKSP